MMAYPTPGRSPGNIPPPDQAVAVGVHPEFGPSRPMVPGPTGTPHEPPTVAPHDGTMRYGYKHAHGNYGAIIRDPHVPMGVN